MINKRILAIVLVAVGLLLFLIAYQASESVSDQVTEAVTGRFTDSTIWLIILGTAATVAGAVLLWLGSPINSKH